MTLNEGIRIAAERANYETSRCGLIRAGLVIAEKDESPPPPFVWVDGILSKDDALEHPPFQRFNKIPGMDYICYKSTLFRSLNEARRQFPHLFDVYPKTYLLPREFLEFKREHALICGKDMIAPFWVVKPRNACCGKGISIVQSIAEIQTIAKESVAQLYVRPYLIGGRKFDFRFFVLIASLDPLTIFLYQEGIARFCTEAFESPSRGNREKKFMHLTNTAINIENSQEPPSTFTKLATEVLRDLAEMDGRGADLWQRICEASRAVMIGLFPTIIHNLPKKCDHRPPKKEGLFSTRRREKKVSVPLIDLPEPPPQEATLPTPSARLPPQLRRSSHATNAEVIRHHTQMVIIPTPNAQPSKAPPDIMVVGSILHYQILPPPAIPSFMRQQFWMAPRRRSISVSPDPQTRRIPAAQTDLLPPIPPNVEEEDRADPEKEPVVEEESGPPPLKMAKRFFHILGIDIILDAEMNPQVLELNDRPSLSVTVEFEQDLKEAVIAEAFEHVKTNGDVRGNAPTSSRWTQIFPVVGPVGNVWKEVIVKLMNPNPIVSEVQKQPLPPAVVPKSRLEFTQTHKEKRKRKRSNDKSSG